MQKDEYVISFRVSDGNTVKLEHHNSLPSTAELAKNYAALGYPDRYAIVTEKQAKSPINGLKLSNGDTECGLFISCILRPSMFPSQATLLGPLAAVAFATALEEHSSKKVGIGWVTDIYCEGSKIGGCALEGKLDSHASYEYIIVSFAAKLNSKEFPPRLTDMVRQVFEAENLSIETIIAKTVLNKFFSLYRNLKNPSKFMDTYRNKFVLTGKKIKYITDGKKINVRVMGVDKDNCSLVIEGPNGEIKNVFKPSSVIIPKSI